MGGWANGWTEKFKKLKPHRREIILDHAVRIVMGDGSNEGDKGIAIDQIHAAFDVDPILAFSIITKIQGGGASQEDVDKAQAEATQANENFKGLAQSIVTLRETLVDMNMIGKKDRMPETLAQWKEAVARVVGREAQKVQAREQHLEQQRLALETMREAALQQIGAAEAQAQIKIAQLAKMSSDFFAGLSGNIGISVEQLSNLSFDYSQIQARESAKQVQGEGVFAGLWIPKHANGNPLGIECEIWVAPEDLIHAPNVDGLLTYNNTVQAVAGLRNWHGHDGGNFANEVAIMDYLDKTVARHIKQHSKSGSDIWFEPAGMDKWLVPPRILLDGIPYRGEEKQFAENLYDLHNIGDFQDTFTISSSDHAYWYWSSTEHRDNSDCVWNVDFSDGNDDSNGKDGCRLSARPVRVGRVRHLTI